MRRTGILLLVGFGAMVPQAAGVPLLIEEGFAVKQPAGWVTDDWDDAVAHPWKYTNLKDTSSHHGTYTGSKAGIFRFDRSGSPGVSMALVTTLAVDLSEGNTFDASGWFAWKGDYGDLATAQNARMGINILAGGFTQFTGMSHHNGPGISLSNLLSSTTGSSQWVQDSAATLVAPPGTTHITVVLTAYHPNPGSNKTIDIKYDDVQIVQTPEPMTLLLLLGALPLLRRRA
ncbi:MAG: hypothetical protein AMXMBFR13_29290 [Phycisphaerae bacterium]